MTFDILFDDPANYRLVKNSGLFTPQRVASWFGVPLETVTVLTFFDPAMAIKFTLRRPRPAGGPGETDAFGAQQYGPLLQLEVPRPEGQPAGSRATGGS